MKAYIFDIDGTLSDPKHRLHHIHGEKKDWPAFFNACEGDAPIPHMVELARTILKGCEDFVLFVTGRSDQVRNITVDWLQGQLGEAIGETDLYMRREGDHRPDNIVKSELLDQVIADGYEPIMVFEDRDQVVKMWRERGIPCAQVAEGNF